MAFSKSKTRFFYKSILKQNYIPNNFSGNLIKKFLVIQKFYKCKRNALSELIIGTTTYITTASITASTITSTCTWTTKYTTTTSTTSLEKLVSFKLFNYYHHFYIIIDYMTLNCWCYLILFTIFHSNPRLLKS